MEEVSVDARFLASDIEFETHVHIRKPETRNCPNISSALGDKGVPKIKHQIGRRELKKKDKELSRRELLGANRSMTTYVKNDVASCQLVAELN